MAKKCLIRDNKFFTTDGKESELYKDLEKRVGEVEARELFLLSHTPTFKENRDKKQAQVSIVNKYNPAPNSYNTWVRSKEDVKTASEAFATAFEDGEMYSDFTVKDMKRALKDGSVTVYSSYEIKKGVFVTPSKMNAQEYAGGKNGKLFSKKVKLDEIAWIDEGEGQYAPISEEPTAEEILKYVENNFSNAQPLTDVEKSELVALDIENVETSEDLYNVLSDVFYKDGVFTPDAQKMKSIYSDSEIRAILSDVEVLARVKETIEKLRNTEPFNIIKIEENEDFSFKTLSPNIIGQFKSNNPLQEKAIYEEENGGEGFIKVPTIDENGEVVEQKLIYDEAVKVVDDTNVLRAVDAVINAPQEVNTQKVQDKVQKWMLNYGVDVSNLNREDFQTLKDFIENPTTENTIALEQALGFERKPKEQFIKISPQNRTYRKLKTTKTEQQLFDELSLIKTNTPDVYHQINKIDEQEMRNIVGNQNQATPEYELYKEYYNYKRENLRKEYRSIKNKKPIFTKRHLEKEGLQEAKMAFENYTYLNLPLSATYMEVAELLSTIENGEVLDKLPYNLIEEDYGVKEEKIRELIDLYHRAENVLYQAEKKISEYKEDLQNRDNIKSIQTNIETDINYLQDEFVADFAAEKLKNPNDEFYQQFKITENGIELVSNDEITIAKVMAQINSHPKLADYSLISKSLPNLKSVSPNTFQTKEDRRVVAVNNKQSLPSPITEVIILDDNFIEAKEETTEFLRIGENVFEQQEQGIYSKLQFEENPLYYTMKVSVPEYRTFEKSEEVSAEKEIKKLTDKKIEEENFSCL